jgi:outer membrane receptor for Fe3+-dicitrate
MTPETIQQLQAIGVDPVKASQGVTFGPNGTVYSVVEFFSKARGARIFRLRAGDRLTLRAEEQVRAIFS